MTNNSHLLIHNITEHLQWAPTCARPNWSDREDYLEKRTKTASLHGVIPLLWPKQHLTLTKQLHLRLKD